MITVNPKIFKAYDIRGIYPTEVNEEAMEQIARAIFTFFSRDLKKASFTILLSRDMRLSGPSLYEVVKNTFVKCGATVIDSGVNSTPTAYFSTLNGGYDTGVQITASHNPKEYAGVKFVKRDGDKLVKIGKNTGMDEIKRLTLEQDFTEFTDNGTIQQAQHVLEDELTKMIELVKPEYITDLNIVADAANAMGSTYIDAIAKRFPINLTRMNFELDGSFPVHEANPALPENVADLQNKVLEQKAQIGITTDGDGDRVMFVNEKGEIIEPTLITSLIVHEILKIHPNERFIVDIRYIFNVQNICKAAGVPLSTSRVGHAFITEQLNNEGAFFAGESSGHYFFKATGGAEASMAVILFVLNALGREKKPISEIVNSLKSAFESGEVNFTLNPETSVPDLLSSIAEKYNDGKENRMDGIAIGYPEWRFGIRTSNTEPLLRLNVEGNPESLVKEKLEEITQFILATGAKLKTGGH